MISISFPDCISILCDVFVCDIGRDLQTEMMQLSQKIAAVQSRGMKYVVVISLKVKGFIHLFSLQSVVGMVVDSLSCLRRWRLSLNACIYAAVYKLCWLCPEQHLELENCRLLKAESDLSKAVDSLSVRNSTLTEKLKSDVQEIRESHEKKLATLDEKIRQMMHSKDLQISKLKEETAMHAAKRREVESVLVQLNRDMGLTTTGSRASTTTSTKG